MTQTGFEQGIEDKLDKVLASVGDITTFIRQQEIRISLLENVAKENKEAIKGNGKPGLQTEVALLKDSVGRINWVGGLLISAIILDIVARLLASK